MSGTRMLAVAAAASALLAALAGAPDARAGDYVSALEVASWIREQRGVRVLDLREEAAYRELAVPTATHAHASTLAAITWSPTDTIVVYAADGAAATQARDVLRTAGVKHVYILSGGIYGWVTEVLNPTLPEQSTREQEAAFARVAELSRYFGGVPRRGDPAGGSQAGAQPARDADAVRRIVRRGC